VSFASLGGVAATRVLAQSPAWGRLWADVSLAEAAAIESHTTLKIGAFEQVVTVVSGGIVDGIAKYRVVAGAGGWGTPIAKKAYANDAGVKASNVIADAAAACGETIGTSSSARLGPHYARIEGEPASVTLNYAAPRNWYIDAAGVTQVGQRASSTFSGDAPRIHVDLGAGVVDLAVAEIGALVPGVIVDGHAPATDVEYDLDAKRLIVRVYFAPQRDRLLAAFGKIVDALYPRLKFQGTYEFRVVTQSGERLNLQPARVATGLPDLQRVPVRPGVSGFRSDVTPGELVIVTFTDGDPSRPQVIAHDAADSPAWLPSLSEFGDGDFLAQKTAIDNIQAKLDDLVTLYNAHVHPTGVGPSGPTASIETPVGAQESCAKLKGE
jgi:hypothetical protein